MRLKVACCMKDEALFRIQKYRTEREKNVKDKMQYFIVHIKKNIWEDTTMNGEKRGNKKKQRRTLLQVLLKLSS